MPASVIPFIIGLVVLLVFAVGLVGLFKAFYRKVDQGTALIVNDLSSEPKVRFTGALIIPVLYKAEEMAIRLINLEVDRRGREGLICRDNMRADIRVNFYLRVNENPEDVLKVAKAVGVARASDRDAVDALFNAKFSEALKTVGKRFDFLDLFEKRQEFRDAILDVIGKDLNGYVLEDVAIDYLEQTKKVDLDANNIMDAEGIRKITQMTAAQNIQTNELEQDERLAITKKNTTTRENILQMERQVAEAEAVQQREVATIQSRENAETARVQEENRLIAEQARIEAQEKISLREQDQMRAVEVAEQNRRRAVVIEQERVERAQQLEKVTTDREVQLQVVERDTVVEEGRKKVADVVRERVMIDQTVAVAEEKINETRVVSEADRRKQVTILDAEAVAQEDMVRRVRAAEAESQSAGFRAKEITTIAEAELTAAGRQAEAKRVLADGIKAEQAAPGLAEAMVQEARANAAYKQGNAEARVTAERLAAEAEGREKMGLAEATATRSMGEAEAVAISGKMMAEAEGLVKKFEAMGQMSPESREHEEFRMQLQTNLEQALAAIAAGKEISRENAGVLAAAMKDANIEMIGGDGGVFDSMLKGLSIGKAIEGIASESPLLQQVVGRLAGITPAKLSQGDGASKE